MKFEKFKIINLIKELIINIDKNLTNFPKREMELKNNIKNTSYNLLLTTYEANATENLEHKNELLNKTIAQVKYLDFLINLCYDKQIINGKRYIKFGEKLDDIIRYIIGWKKSINRVQLSGDDTFFDFWLASRNVNGNYDNANWGLFNINSDTLNENNLYNSNGNENNNNYYVRPVASIN